MFCNRCGNKVETNEQYCNQCGNPLTYQVPNRSNQQEPSQNNLNQYNTNTDQQNNTKKSNNRFFLTVLILGILIVVLLVIASGIILSSKKEDYYFNEGMEPGQIEQTTQEVSSSSKKGKYKTAIITDNVYSGISVKSISDANELICEDSVRQKQADYPKEIIQIEEDIIKNYAITAVNLKEMEVGFAKELKNVVKKIYQEYPKARGYLTNLTLTNLDMSESGVIALFRPIFTFGTSDTSTTRPWVIKTQIELNAKYFLNSERIEQAVSTSSKSGHFPKNATKYSPVAHEFGHYLSFIALLNNHSTKSIVIIEDRKMQDYYDIYSEFRNGTFSKQMLEEAHQNYIRDHQNVEFDTWRGQISKYALAKDDSGSYIYDETIAEAFHDVYLNGNNANIASKYIVEVLKKYIER